MQMSLFLPLLLALLACLNPPGVDSIRCYECQHDPSRVNDTNCADPLSHPEVPSTVCGWGNTCHLNVYSDNVTVMIIRNCTNAMYSCDMCYTRQNNEISSCACRTDNCNSAPVTLLPLSLASPTLQASSFQSRHRRSPFNPTNKTWLL